MFSCCRKPKKVRNDELSNPEPVCARKEMGSEDWKIKWKSRPHFHIDKAHPDLLEFEEKVFSSKSRVLLPLCGKTIDLKYLADKGHEVVGVELLETPVRAFFEDNVMEYRKITLGDDFDVYKATNNSITIYRGDVFRFSVDFSGTFDVIWDRGGFSAINVSQRKAYVALMTSLMTEEGKYVINHVFYDERVFGGPPHPAKKLELEKFLGDAFYVESLIPAYDAVKNHRVPHQSCLDEFWVSNSLITKSNMERNVS